VISHAARFSPEAILMEDKASGQSMLQDLRSETALPLIAVMPKGDKMTRLARVSAMIEAGSVALPYHARWLAGFEQEIMAFPNAAHDDQVDAFSQYLGWVHEKNRRSDARIRRL
jgi:predicted phage terminase large subunit-like protein